MTGELNPLDSASSQAEDLDTVTETAGKPYPQPTSPTVKDLATRQERTRSYLAIGFVCILASTVIGVGALITFASDKVSAHEDIINLIWTSEVTLVGSVLGFYFGTKQ